MAFNQASQIITRNEPGTILTEIATFLHFVNTNKVSVSPKKNFISVKSTLTAINDLLSNPDDVNLIRPAQKSYPTITGLYVLLLSIGLMVIEEVDQKFQMTVNKEAFSLWDSLNFTEQYFTLLEAWVIHADPEILESPSFIATEGIYGIHFGHDLDRKVLSLAEPITQQSLTRRPGLHNLVLMKLFGFAEVEMLQPKDTKTLLVTKLNRTNFGEIMMKKMHAFLLNSEFPLFYEGQEAPMLNFFQPLFQSQFPEWKKIFNIMRKVEHSPGLYTLKVTLGGIWRRIEVSGDMDLDSLGRLIRESVDFDSDHLDMFIYRSAIGKTVRITHPFCEEEPDTLSIKIEDLGLTKGKSFKYVFDLGDKWEFQIKVEKVDLDDLRTRHGKLIESIGDAPSQYEWYEDN
jgi:hypothetical protein